ncbi:L,D-transpeptidase [Thermanaerothrix daxensis]|uniref:L,D-transpeptidase n=1 Tax=Thermanaerothrix daxensis TaxID=869279 RepID=UPI0006C90119|nr:L,D-transpeptidase [Thermanaerothrix daxensis]
MFMPGLDLPPLTRREFLRWCAGGLLALVSWPWWRLPAHPGKVFAPQDFNLSLGRIIPPKTEGFDRPSFSGNIRKTYWRDLVLPITGVTLGDDTSSHNRIWYLLNDEAYVHSGEVQPVALMPQPVETEIPPQGRLFEVSVPYTDALWNPRLTWSLAYRLYYGCTFWVTQVLQDDKGQWWYRIADDKWPVSYFVRAPHLRAVSPEAVAPLSPQVPAEQKRIEVRLADQVVIAWEGERPVFAARAATGARFHDGDYRTPPGRYQTHRKRPSRHMAAGDRAAPNSYDLPGVPWVSYLMDNGISFHGTYWHNDFGRPRSHGCINLSPQDALWIYRWTHPTVPLDFPYFVADTGTLVIVVE